MDRPASNPLRCESLRTPGFQYAWLSRDSLLEIMVGGMARWPGVAMSPAATFNGYSVTKTLTAAAVRMLASRGAFGLDAPLLPLLGLPARSGASPTVRQTLQHRGGFGNPLPLAWAHPAGEAARFDAAAFIARILRQQGKPRTPPGERTRYSNPGYLLLGELVARAGGCGYTTFVERELLRPLGLEGKAWLSFDLPADGRHAAGHLRRWGLLDASLGLFVERRRFAGPARGRWREIADHLVDGAAYGGIIASVLGLAAWLQSRFRDDVAPAEERGLGWFQGQLRGHDYLCHAGGGLGYYCEARWYPGAGRASVLMLNRAGLSDARLLDVLDAGRL